jgi:hypothetical protein
LGVATRPPCGTPHDAACPGDRAGPSVVPSRARRAWARQVVKCPGI